jgi:hypothetical protein
MSSILGKSIDDLKASIAKHGGLAQTNRFAIYMQPPAASLLNLDLQGAVVSALSGNFKPGNLINDPRDMTLLCESCTLPGRQITTIDYQSIRQSNKVPYGYFNEDVTFTYLLTQDYYIKKIFDKWAEAVIDTKNYRARYQDEYATDVVIQQLDTNNLPIYGIKLLKAYPITVNAITLDNAQENSPQKLSVTMTFEDFVIEGAITSAISSVKTAIGGIKKLF